ncbi:peptidoglycan glycosyltransferase [Leptotrichia sp. OH3620_COT-345]|uniref:penicillin-binding transpeptidase domain-containing protein n=1 Tax=Leptotrichia sp. OH3620_COT-345 TaxID=2491048 RepID=UPI000F649ABB|nr:penicillin-binding transpeptidase domain-containing protein [Leptotrichia sp. OH3620_COT-345]RRD39936.1 peptidoglycan glycosyltransferase [Leptotrichia sp. OH3620_COT-345]
MKTWNSFRFRLMILVIFIISGFVWIIVNLFYIQIIRGNEWQKTGELQYKSEFTVKSKRGRIITGDGEVLAYDGETYDIVLDPTLVDPENIDKLTELLKKSIPSFDVSKVKNDILEKRKQNKKYLKLDYVLGYNEKKDILDILSKDKSLKSGVFFETNYIRNYIKNRAFQETIGYLDVENKGIYGIEKTYNDQLTGVDGVIEGFRIPRKFTTISALKDTKEVVLAKNGNNIFLTLDSVLQYTLDDELRKTYEQYSAVSAMGILMEVETGKILAMSSYPKARNNAEVKNRPITDLFEPGSIFKPITVAAGMQAGVINQNSIIESSGNIKVADRVIKDHDSSTTGSLNLESLIAKSGNVGMVKIAQMMKNKDFYSYLEKVGLGKKTGIDTFSETTQKLLPLKEMTEVKKSNISFGQGIAMTQIQMLMALNTVINHGKLIKPYLVDHIEDEEGNIVLQNSPVVLENVFSEEISKLNRYYMEAVVTKGTGRGAQVQGYRIGGKTGTAQKSGARGYEAGKYFSSFFAFFPVENPKYAILITINEPQGAYYGAAVALPSAKQVLEKLIKYKGINPQGVIVEKKQQSMITLTAKNDLKKIAEEFGKDIMPNLGGISLRELLSVYPQEKFPKYKISGSGKVKEQLPLAGAKLTKDTEIKIVLE